MIRTSVRRAMIGTTTAGVMVAIAIATATHGNAATGSDSSCAATSANDGTADLVQVVCGDVPEDPEAVMTTELTAAPSAADIADTTAPTLTQIGDDSDAQGGDQSDTQVAQTVELTAAPPAAPSADIAGTTGPTLTQIGDDSDAQGGDQSDPQVAQTVELTAP